MLLIIEPTLPLDDNAREERCIRLADILDNLEFGSPIMSSPLLTALRDNFDSSDDCFNRLFHEHRFVEEIPVYVRDYKYTPYPKYISVGSACCASDALELVQRDPNYEGRDFSSFTFYIHENEKNWEVFGYHLVYRVGPQLVL